MLFGLFNPVLDSMRGLCAASHLKRVQEDVCSRPVSLGSFSEAQGVFDPELLKHVFLELAGEIPTSWGDVRLAHLADKLKLVDGTLLPALPRMHWALWLNDQNRAAKLHLKFTVLRQTPSDALITHGNSCEQVEVDGKELLLATDLEIEAELISLIYRYRWQIELFFKWMKSILGNRHLMAGSPEGVAIQTYSELIAALMLQLLTGKRPTKRAMELIRFHMMGHAELEEAIALLGLKKRQVRIAGGNRREGASPGFAWTDCTPQLENTVAKSRIVAASLKITGFLTTPPISQQASCRTFLGQDE
jgi:hypothetical protein